MRILRRLAYSANVARAKRIAASAARPCFPAAGPAGILHIGIPDEEFQHPDHEVLAGWEHAVVDHVSRPGQALHYEYDFGDGWSHRIVLQEVVARETGGRYPRCMSKRGDCYDCDDARAAEPDGLTPVTSDHGVLALTCRPSGQQQSEWPVSRTTFEQRNVA